MNIITPEIITVKSYKDSLLKHASTTEIDLKEMISIILSVYGKIHTDSDPEGIQDKNSGKYMPEDNLNKILTLILTEQCYNLAITININPEYSDKLYFTYNTKNGNGYIKLIE